ncbi:hypothetical protein Q5P01_005590 [Channa striata]|uniref:Uncharacterized protein n=1 Tax=Channa striata TaxID=64152 RepID=A0AA88T1F9_CHASR|nr:hypothetical protein Q5P01_005590 [Channa striata]
MTLSFMNGQQEALPLLLFDTAGKEVESPRASICASQNGCCNSLAPTYSVVLQGNEGDEEGKWQFGLFCLLHLNQ